MFHLNFGFLKTLIKGIEVKGLNKISLTQTLQEMLNNETTYSNGEFQLFFKMSINAKSKFHYNKNM